MSVRLIDLIVDDTVAFLKPLLDAAQNTERLATLLEKVGASPNIASDALMTASLQALVNVRDQVLGLAEQSLASIAGVRELLQAANSTSEVVRTLGAFQGPGYASFGTDLGEYLAVTWFALRYPLLFRIADLLDLVEMGPDAETVMLVDNGESVLRYPFRRQRFRTERVGALLNDLPGSLKANYAPNGLETDADAHDVAVRLFPRLGYFLRRLGLRWTYGLPVDHRPFLGDAAPFVEHAGLLHLPDVLTQGTEGGALVTLSSSERGGLGVVVMPFGVLDATQAVGRWNMELSATADIEGIAFGRHGVTLLAPPGVESASAHVKAVLGEDPADGLAFVFGASDATRLEIGGFEVGAAVLIDDSSHSMSFHVAASKCALVITPGDGDSLLRAVIPSDGARVAFELALGWSTQRGFTLSGSAGAELTIPSSVDLGPLALDGVHVAVLANGEAVTFELSGLVRAKLGPVTIGVDGFGLRGTVGFPSSGGSLGGSAFDLDVRMPRQLSVAIRSSLVRGGGVLTADPPAGRYGGALALEVGGLSLAALGVLDTRVAGVGYSLAAIVSAETAPVPLPFGFMLDGVGGMVGVNRRVDLEALRAAIRGPGMGDIFFAADPVAQAARLTADLARYFPAQDGRHVFGPAVRLRWGTPALLRATVAVLLEVPSPVRLALLGNVVVALPSEEHPIVRLGADVVGDVDLAEKRIAIDASLRSDSTIAGFPITGDMALRLGWGSSPEFALSIGGFHSQFRRPLGFPELRPILIPIGSGDDPRLDVTGFLALTSNTAQAGANVELYASAGPLNIRGTLGFEALIVFSPFSWKADVWAGVTLRRGSRVLAAIHFDGSTSGPWPWRVDGTATLSLWFVDLSVSVHVMVGGGDPVVLSPQEIWPHLRAVIEERESWSPAAGSATVVTSPPVGENAPPARIAPGVALAMRQSLVPLDRRITRYAHVPPAGVDRFRISELRVGTAAVATTPVFDWFAPAQFEELGEADTLSRPGFEQMVAGIAAVDTPRGGPSLTKTLEYETIVWADGRRQEGAPFQPSHYDHVAGVALGAVAQAPTFAPPARPPCFTLSEETHTIASSDDLRPRSDLIGHVTRGQAELALRAHLAGAPADAGSLIVVPSHELAA